MKRPALVFRTFVFFYILFFLGKELPKTFCLAGHTVESIIEEDEELNPAEGIGSDEDIIQSPDNMVDPGSRRRKILSNTNGLRGGKIFLLIVADTNDGKIGKSVKADVRNLTVTFMGHVPKKQLNMKVLSGRNVTKQKILNTIKQFHAKSSDAMVFFWSGHGAYDQRGHFFKMPNGERLYRSTVVKTVRKQGAGMDAVLSDCCNKFVSLKEVPVAFEPHWPKQISPLFNSLFLKTRGLVDMNGASEGEFGFGDPNDGGTFIKPLCDYMAVNGNKSLSWNNLVAQIRPKVQAAFEQVTKGISVEAPHGSGKQTTQSVRVWHLPPGWPPRPGGGNAGGAGGALGRYHPEVGDVIVEVNGKKIRTRQECIDAVNSSPEIMVFVARGKQSGKRFTYRTRLRSKNPRFGVNLSDTGGDGAKLTQLSKGFPCKKCEWVR